MIEIASLYDLRVIQTTATAAAAATTNPNPKTYQRWKHNVLKGWKKKRNEIPILSMTLIDTAALEY